MKTRIKTKINYKWTDCDIRQVDMIVTISYLGEVVCEVTNVKNFNEILFYIKCMFESSFIYSKISSNELKKIFKDTVRFTIKKKVKEVAGEIVNEVIDTVKSVKFQNMIERTLTFVKKWIYSSIDSTIASARTNQETVEYKNPIPNLRFNFL